MRVPAMFMGEEGFNEAAALHALRDHRAKHRHTRCGDENRAAMVLPKRRLRLGFGPRNRAHASGGHGALYLPRLDAGAIVGHRHLSLQDVKLEALDARFLFQLAPQHGHFFSTIEPLNAIVDGRGLGYVAGVRMRGWSSGGRHVNSLSPTPAHRGLSPAPLALDVDPLHAGMDAAEQVVGNRPGGAGESLGVLFQLPFAADERHGVAGFQVWGSAQVDAREIH